MKILFVSPYIGSTYGGISKIVIDLVEELSQLNLDVDLVTTNANNNAPLNVSCNVWISQSNYRIQYFSSWNRNDLILSPSLMQWLLNNVKNYQLVHTYAVFMPMMLLTHWVCQFYKIPYIMTPQGMLEPWALSYKAWKKRYYHLFLDKPTLQRASAIQCMTSIEEKQIQELGINSPTVIIPNGIHPKELETVSSPEEFYKQFPTTRNKDLILFMGRIDPKKGLDLLAPAFARVHGQFPQTHLVVAGPDSIGFLPQAQRYFAEAGCSHAVTFTGMLTGTLKSAALAAASCYVAPSYSEGFSMSVLEGMASGLPCVITTGCNFPEAATAQAAQVVSPDADAIAEALIQCLSQPEWSKEMGCRARELIFQSYTWEKIANRLFQVYQSILTQENGIQS